MTVQQKYTILVATLAMACLSLISCAPERPIETVEVDVPVDTGCKIEYPVKPVWKTDTLAADAKISDKTKALILDFDAAKSYIEQLIAATSTCAN